MLGNHIYTDITTPRKQPTTANIASIGPSPHTQSESALRRGQRTHRPTNPPSLTLRHCSSPPQGASPCPRTHPRYNLLRSCRARQDFHIAATHSSFTAWSMLAPPSSRCPDCRRRRVPPTRQSEVPEIHSRRHAFAALRFTYLRPSFLHGLEDPLVVFPDTWSWEIFFIFDAGSSTHLHHGKFREDSARGRSRHALSLVPCVPRIIPPGHFQIASSASPRRRTDAAASGSRTQCATLHAPGGRRSVSNGRWPLGGGGGGGGGGGRGGGSGCPLHVVGPSG